MRKLSIPVQLVRKKVIREKIKMVRIKRDWLSLIEYLDFCAGKSVVYLFNALFRCIFERIIGVLQNFLTLTASVRALIAAEVRAKYPKQVAERLLISFALNAGSSKVLISYIPPHLRLGRGFCCVQVGCPVHRSPVGFKKRRAGDRPAGQSEGSFRRLLACKAEQ